MKSQSSHAGPLVGGTLLIALGLLSLASQLFRNVVNWGYLWPLTVIVFGSLFFAGMFLGGRQVSGLAVPGAIITGIGLMLLYQNVSGYWESWAYSWTLIVVLVGVGIYIAGAYGRIEGQKQAGIRVIKIGFVLFVIFGAFFEMIFSMDRSLGFRGLLFPALLILLGIYLIVRRLGPWSGSGHNEADAPVPPEPPAVIK